MTAPSKYAATRFLYGIVSLVVIGIVVFVAFTANQGRLPWAQPDTVRAAFDNIGQLHVGSEVRQNGLKVGQVSAVDIVEGHPVVTMKINNGQPVYRDGYAGIYDLSSLAQKFVEIRSGNPESGPLGDAVIPMSQTESSHDLVDVLNVFDEPTRQSLGNAVRQLGGGMAGYGPGFHDFMAAMPTMEENTRTLAATLVSERTDLPGLLRSTDRASSRFAGREQMLNSLLKQTDATIRAFGADSAQPLAATLDKLPNTLHTVRAALDSVNPPLADLAVATGEMRTGAGSLGQATPDVRGVFREARAPFDDVPDFADEAKPAVDDLTDTFSDLRPFVPRLGDGLRSAVPPLAVLKPYHRDIGTFATDVNSLINQHEGWTHHFRGMLAAPSATTIEQLPVKDVGNPYPAPGEAYTQRNKLGGAIPAGPRTTGGR